jgi:hypothetical protein
LRVLPCADAYLSKPDFDRFSFALCARNYSDSAMYIGAWPTLNRFGDSIDCLAAISTIFGMVFGVSIELWADQGAKAFWAPRELARPLTLWVLIGPLALWVSIGLWAFWAAYVLVILAFTTPDRRGV